MKKSKKLKYIGLALLLTGVLFKYFNYHVVSQLIDLSSKPEERSKILTTWDYPSIRISGYILGWNKPTKTSTEAVRRGNNMFNDHAIFGIIGLVSIIVGIILLVKAKKLNRIEPERKRSTE